MKHYHVLLAVLICLVFLLPTTITGVSSGNPSDSQTEGLPAAQARADRPKGTSFATMSEAEAEKLPPLQRELRRILLEERDDLAVLTDRLAAIEDRIVALEVQRRISERKFRTQIELLEIQGHFARAEGQIELAEEAEHAAAQLKAHLERGGE